MSKIVILDEKTANQIAAGEVIERPASVVKEMVENAIDAGATQITIEIKKGGISYIRITDNGMGMEGDDVELAFERHSTSKLRRIEDLDGLSTMGFRGEALASIASVSHLEVATMSQNSSVGTKMVLEGGRVKSVNQAGCPVGTTFIVRELFYNTPARYKFLKKDSTEAGYVSDIIERLALSYPGISFKLIQDNTAVLHTPGNHDLLSVIYSIYGKDISHAVLPVSYENDGYILSGFVGKPEISRGTRSSQSVFINGRYIKNRVIISALEEAYKTMLMQNRFPFCVLLIKAPPQLFDVNVHPQKLEVRFSNESSVYSLIYHGVKSSLLGTSLIRDYNKKPDETGEAKPENTRQAIFQRLKEKDFRYDENNSVNSSSDAMKKMTEQKASLPGAKSSVIIPQNIKQGSLFEIGILEQKTDCGEKSAEVERVADKIIDIGLDQEKKAEISAIEIIADNADKINLAESNPNCNTYGCTSADVKMKPKDSTLNELLHATIVGQAFDTYVLLQYGENLYIIDQHAAHERIRYEMLKKRLLSDESFSQVIMEPFIVKLSAKEYDFVMGKQEGFNKLGFDIEAFGPSTIILRSIPDFYDTSFGVTDFHEILDRWMNSREEQGISDEALFTMSCKGAIKANRVLSKEEIKGLVNDLCTMENPYTCVHGRPVIINMEKREFERKFKRVL